MLLSISQLDLLRNLIHSHTGIFYPPKKNFFLEYRVQMLMRKSGYEDASVLLKDLSMGREDLWDFFVKSFTTNHTYFFREAEHFDIMLKDIADRNIHRPTLWDAASSTGEEVYSIAICFRERLVTGYRILASDINRNNLLQLKEGVYGESRIRTMPKAYVRRYFDTLRNDGGETMYKVKPELKDDIFTKVLNLSVYLKFETTFNYIFCRNVLMYFQPETQVQVVEMMGENLEENGLLFIGHSENLLRPCRDLEQIGLAVYRKKAGYGKNKSLDRG